MTMKAADRSAQVDYGFDIFDLRVRIRADHDTYLTIPRAFMDAYAEPDRGPRAPDIGIEVCTVGALPALDGATVRVHQTKHRHWTFDGVRSEDTRRHLWPSRGIALSRDDAGGAWTIEVLDTADPVLASEAIFHAARSIALYRRPAGHLLHASAVQFGDGSIVAFAGRSMAGKTTLFDACIRSGGWRPFTNDRLFFVGETGVEVDSWPSYGSYCEGQLSVNAALRRGASAYEDGAFAFRTQSWGQVIHADFDKTRKRTYPMMWQRSCIGQGFGREGRLTALVFPRVSPELDVLSMAEFNLTEPADVDRLEELCAQNSFDLDEPSFLPWHGLSAPASAGSQLDLVRRLAAAEVRVAELRVPVDLIERVPDMVRALVQRPHERGSDAA